MDPSYGDEIAVVTVTYSPGALLDTFLDSLREATSRPVRVVLADNGSVDGAPEKAERERDDVALLRIGENVGYGAGANRGVAELGPEVGWVVVANPDLRWLPGSLDALLEAARRWPRAGALGPLIREPSGEIDPLLTGPAGAPFASSTNTQRGTVVRRDQVPATWIPYGGRSGPAARTARTDGAFQGAVRRVWAQITKRSRALGYACHHRSEPPARLPQRTLDLEEVRRHPVQIGAGRALRDRRHPAP